MDHGFDLVVAGQHFAAPTLRYLQPIPYLTSIAMQFPTVEVATGILLLPLHHPLTIAEEVATMDAVTGGRVIMGVGIGYSQDEFDAFGVDRTTRTERFEESVEVIRGLWAGQPLTHHGRFYQLDNVELSTLPVQQPHPPIWVGAQVEASVRRAARVGDAWYAAPFPTHRQLVDLYRAYREERAAHGHRALTAIPVRREVYIADNPVEAEAAVSSGAASRYGTRGGSRWTTASAAAIGWTTGSCSAAPLMWPRGSPTSWPRSSTRTSSTNRSGRDTTMPTPWLNSSGSAPR